MRRHYSNYFKGIPNFKDYRMQLVKLESLNAINEVLEDISNKFDEVLA